MADKLDLKQQMISIF